MRLFVVPLELSEANALVARWHRHHQPSQGHRFSLGVKAGGGQWKHTDGKPRRTDQPTELKERWAKNLAARPDLAAVPLRTTEDDAPDLFGGAA